MARHIVERGSRGKIVFISSVHALRPCAGSVAYNAAKAGLNNMAHTIAVEFGWIDTPGEREQLGSEMLAREAPKLPWGRLGTPEDIGRGAAFLCSDDADYISGTILRVDGCYVFRDCIDEF